MVTIYKMLDPDTKQIRYIGKTTKTIAQRLKVSLFNGYKFPGAIPVCRIEDYDPKTEADAVKAILADAPPVKFLLR